MWSGIARRRGYNVYYRAGGRVVSYRVLWLKRGGHTSGSGQDL